MSITKICSLLAILISTSSCLSLPNYEGPIQDPSGHVDVAAIDNSHCNFTQQVCVRRTHCLDHLIEDDAEVIPNLREGQRSCIDPGHPDKPALCCSDPGAPQPLNSEPAEIAKPAVSVVHRTSTFDGCPDHKVCVSQSQCGNGGNVITDGAGFIDIRIKHKECVVNKISKEIGVCCTPPQDVTQSTTTVKPNHNQCGIRQKNTNPEILAGRILGNTADNEAEFGEYPWQAVIFSSNYTFICGASLIGDRWLLTAAHCVNGIKPEDLRVRLGEWTVNTFDEPLPYIDFEVSSIKIHPKFNNRNLHNDLSIIELKELVTFQYHINPICLPIHGQTFWGQRCISTGWGKNAIDGQYQTIMKEVELPMVDHTTCQYQLRKTRLGRYFTLDKSFVCAGGEENEDACKGDGGGPLACQDHESGHYMLTGITAWGVGCGNRNVPGAFINVQAFIPWIQLTIYDIQ